MGVFMLVAGVALLLTWVGLMVFEASLTKKSEGKRQALEAARTPGDFGGEGHAADPEDPSDDADVQEETIRPLEPVVEGDDVVLDELSVIPVVEKPGDVAEADSEERVYEFGEALDQETLDWYAEIRAQYPDFKGWVELPYWGISYPIFVNDEDPLKYERMTRDGEFSYLGEVNYQGHPTTSDNLILFGHSLYDMSGFSKIDNLPEEDLGQLEPGALEVWIDLYDEGVRRHYRMVNAKYYPRADISWAYTDFSTDEARMRYIEDYAYLDYDPGQLLTLATCVDAVGDYKAIIHCVPVD